MSDFARRLLAFSAAGAAIALIASTIERTRIRLDRYTLPLEYPGIPLEGITILHLSDLHSRSGGFVQRKKLHALRRLLEGQPYDLVVISGDLIHNAAGIDAALALVSELRPRLRSFSCLGNRDYWESSFSALFSEPGTDGKPKASRNPGAIARRVWRFGIRVLRNERASLHYVLNDVDMLNARLRDAGCTPLVNCAATLQIGEARLWIAGIDDLREGTPDIDGVFEGVPNDAPVILLSHNPDIWADPRSRRADLILAGHTHGGQIVLPWVGAFYTQGTHMARRKPSGWFFEGRASMFVSRGIGESFPIRLGAPPQVALIRIVGLRPVD